MPRQPVQFLQSLFQSLRNGSAPLRAGLFGAALLCVYGLPGAAPPDTAPAAPPPPAAGALPPLPPDSTVPSTAPGDSATDRSTATRDTAQETARVPPDSVRTPLVIPDSTWRWPEDARATTCTGPLETMTACWRSPGATAEIAARETGFPGIRATALALRGLEPARTEAFFQPALAFSPYGTGGQRPFTRFEADAARGLVVERWAPVQPLDTPVTDLHWMRGALLMNQFGITLHRMVGNRAYVSFDYLSSGAERMFYDYAFQVHQPYLGAGRDSLSLVIEDTSHAIAARQIRPRVGVWLDPQTVAEVWADWFSNATSMANPTNPAANDSVQSLYDASFAASTFGGVLARTTDAYAARLTARHASWERTLAPRGPRPEAAEGTLSDLGAAWTLRRLPGAPEVTVEAELSSQSGSLWTDGAPGTSGASARDQARADREAAGLAATPTWRAGAWGAAVDLRGEAARRARADGVVEWLGDVDADGRLSLPAGFYLTGGAGFARAGAPDDLLFRWQPALGLYPNPGLTPRTHARLGGGAGWESRHLGLGAAWESHRFDNTWLPRVLPHPNTCLLVSDTLSYRGPGDADAACNGSSLPDSFALAHVNYDRETRELLHLSAYLAAGHWRLSLRSTSLLHNAVRDERLGFEAENFAIPVHVIKGQLLWKRVVLDGRLGLQTRWDWEWFSSRYAFASEGDSEGHARVMLLDEYLALDFTTQMDIKTFSLYFRAMNLFHDRYATEAGVHPPGVNFRFGVNWRLRN